MTKRKAAVRLGLSAAGVAIAALWWMFLAPTAIGGSATYALVAGHSMEPVLHPGDLVVARRASSYRTGELVVFRLGRGMVVHELQRFAADRWRTKGRHNRALDPTAIPASAVLGRHLVTVPRFGSCLAWIAGHPVRFGGGVALIVGVLLLPLPRRRGLGSTGYLPAESTAYVLSSGGRSLLLVSGTCTAITLLAALRMSSLGLLVTPVGRLVSMGLLLSAVITMAVVRAWRDGVGLSEPHRTQCVLGSRVRRVDELPPVSRTRWLTSAVELRRLADRHRRPVLQWSGRWGDSYLLVVGDHGFGLALPHHPLIDRSWPAQKSSRSLNFWSLPVAVRGSDSRNSTRLGHL